MEAFESAVPEFPLWMRSIIANLSDRQARAFLSFSGPGWVAGRWRTCEEMARLRWAIIATDEF